MNPITELLAPNITPFLVNEDRPVPPYFVPNTVCKTNSDMLVLPVVLEDVTIVCVRLLACVTWKTPAPETPSDTLPIYIVFEATYRLLKRLPGEPNE
jgi:hypothetical protein